MSNTSAGTDSGLLAPAWAGTPAAAETTDEAWLQAMVDVEAALARAQARLGMIPRAAAAVITAVAGAHRLDVVELASRARESANPVVVLVEAFTAMVASEDAAAADYVHRGSTSQDILDSATMLITGRVLDRITDDLDRVAAALAELADEHRHTVMAGRTLTQHAVPTTFGLKAAVWLHLVLDAVDRTCSLRSTGLPAALGGAAGTLAAYGEYAAAAGLAESGVELIQPFAEELGLAELVVPWHTARTPIADLGCVLQFVTGALGKFALDVLTLSRTEISEVAEPAAVGRGTSSAMPHKRNPVLATLVVSAARQLPAHALVLAQSMLAEDERPAGAWHAEWQPLREALRLAGGAAHTAAELAEGLVVLPERMAANLTITGSAIVSERLAVALAQTLGKARARQVISGATAKDDTLDEVLAEHVDDPARVWELVDPAGYTGAAGTLVDRVLKRYRDMLSTGLINRTYRIGQP